SVMSTAINQTCIHFQLSERLTKTAMIAGGALSGGISAKMAGGDFIDGLCNGLICVGLNHALHLVVQNTPKIVKVLHELKNFENAMQKDRGPRMTSHYNMCKYAVMEAIAKYSGVSDADQWDYKDIGERFIKWEKANNRPEPLLSSVFEKCGFSVGVVPGGREYEFWPKALDNGKPVVFDYMADDNTHHTATLMALGRDAGGNLMYRLADPMLGVYECQAEQIQVNASYVFYGMK
ncbi:MAG: hypothetical protein IKW82_08460, partial [Bacteroidales bacterium]|nr:hypothetical protein [Bacteroidales bacterium]